MNSGDSGNGGVGGGTESGNCSVERALEVAPTRVVGWVTAPLPVWLMVVVVAGVEVVAVVAAVPGAVGVGAPIVTGAS